MVKSRLPRLDILKPMVGGHPGGCFRELLDCWREADYCDVTYNTIMRSNLEDYHNDETLLPEARVWINQIDDILLYDNTRLDKYFKNYRFALFANEVKHGDKESNWIFWARWPKRYYQYQNDNRVVDYEARNFNTIFIGNFTTDKRSRDWCSYVDFFRLGSSNQHHEKSMLFPYGEYLRHLSVAKFGLCLPGQGPKCLRETELMGLGTVPIFTPGVSTDYFDKLSPDKHYVYVDSPEQLPAIINRITKSEWEYRSQECLNWFERNATIEGSYRMTTRILEERGVI